MNDALRELERFVGRWDTTAEFPTLGSVAGTSEFSWLLDGAFLLQTTDVAHPGAPNAQMLVASDDDGGYTQHYFDSRGVVRLYVMTFDGSRWTLSRSASDFSPLDFLQRFSATFDDGGSTIRGSWESCHDGETWEHDFDLTYSKVD